MVAKCCRQKDHDGPWGNSYHSYRVTCPSHVTKRTSTAPVMLPLKSLSVMYSRTRSSFRRGVTPMAAVPTSWCSKSSQKISLSYQQKVGIQRGSQGFKLLLALIMTYLTLHRRMKVLLLLQPLSSSVTLWPAGRSAKANIFTKRSLNFCMDHSLGQESTTAQCHSTNFHKYP